MYFHEILMHYDTTLGCKHDQHLYAQVLPQSFAPLLQRLDSIAPMPAQ